MTEFVLHPQLEADTFDVTDLDTCKVLLMNDARYPWIILVPRIPGAREIHQLDTIPRQQVTTEIQACSEALEEVIKPYKLNVAALGNQVEQLHIHIVARFQQDAAWPGPVWGVGERTPYATNDAQHMVQIFSERLGR